MRKAIKESSTLFTFVAIGICLTKRTFVNCFGKLYVKTFTRGGAGYKYGRRYLFLVKFFTLVS